MIELPDGTILIRKGEPLPTRCIRCDTIYEVEKPEYNFSLCPVCRNCNDHRKFAWRYVEPPEQETER